MESLQFDMENLSFVCEGKRRYRTLKNKANPPKCRRQLFQDTETSASKVENKTSKKDWIKCLKSCLDFDNQTSLNEFQFYFDSMNSYENEATENERKQGNIVRDSDNGKEFLVLNNLSYSNINYDTFLDQEVLVQYNYNSHIDQSNLLNSSPNKSEYIIGHFYNDVMLATFDAPCDESSDATSGELNDTPSSGIKDVQIMGYDLKIDHEEVIQCISGSYDTQSYSSDEFSGSDEGFPEDFLDDC
ncbi:hypothetical protein LOTGIDRAFT_169132 [Lottia gigantea]|uniref:Uncharacterized protein n=1 Tax=Lottia gigantea TaxID=225164 RepID=V3ZMH9_LOTGI|nr:hypothetical protein LOTGIDRAFT_169132 [Lottia gigantea]ESO83655.1 hypothetical protein LOTGIDRAFT_169132 [Lottia gigantea]